MTYDADIAIIGYGPSGVAAANVLGTYGLSAIAFDREADIYQRARAVTINDWTMRLLQVVGLDAVVNEVMDPTYELRWITYQQQELMRMNFPPGEFGHLRSYAIYQPLMEQRMRDGVDRFDQVTAHLGVEVTGVEQDGDGVTVRTREVATGAESSYRTKYALACDGGSSRTREQLGIKLLGDTIPVRWIIIDARVKRWWPDRHVLTFWSDKDRPVVDIALGLGNHRWEVPLKPGETDADFSSEEQIWPLLESLGVSRDDVDIHQWAFYNHNIRMAERWREGRVFLVGDAGHLMPPWAGAGMQSGIRDAFDISWKLREVLAGRLPDSLLDTYEPERRPNVEFYTQVAIHLGKIIRAQLTPEEVAASAPPEGELPPLLWPPTLEAGFIRGAPTPDSAVGKMLPQPTVVSSKGVMNRLDTQLGQSFVLLGDGVSPAEMLTAEEKAGWDALGTRYVTIRSAAEHGQGPDEIVDIDGYLVAWMRRYGARVIAVRPDKFVAASDRDGLAVPELTQTKVGSVA